MSRHHVDIWNRLPEHLGPDPDPRYAEPEIADPRANRWHRHEWRVGTRYGAFDSRFSEWRCWICGKHRPRRRTFGLPVLIAACALLFALGWLVRGVVGL